MILSIITMKWQYEKKKQQKRRKKKLETRKANWARDKLITQHKKYRASRIQSIDSTIWEISKQLNWSGKTNDLQLAYMLQLKACCSRFFQRCVLDLSHHHRYRCCCRLLSVGLPSIRCFYGSTLLCFYSTKNIFAKTIPKRKECHQRNRFKINLFTLEIRAKTTTTNHSHLHRAICFIHFMCIRQLHNDVRSFIFAHISQQYYKTHKNKMHDVYWFIDDWKFCAIILSSVVTLNSKRYFIESNLCYGLRFKCNALKWESHHKNM